MLLLFVVEVIDDISKARNIYRSTVIVLYIYAFTPSEE